MNEKTSPDLSVSLEGDAAVEYIALKADKLVTEKAIERENKFNRSLTYILSIAGIVGLGAITGVVQLTIGERIKTEVNNQLEETRARFTQEVTNVKNQVAEDAQAVVALLNLQKTTSKLNNLIDMDAPDTRELDRLLSEIESISKNDYAKGQDEYLNILASMAIFLADQGDIDQLSKFDSMYRKDLLRNGDASRRLADYFAFALVADAILPSELPSESERVGIYLDQARQANFPEEYIFWNLLIELKDNRLQRNQRTDDLMESLARLSPIDLKFFFIKIDTYIGVTEEDNAWMQEASSIVATLRDHYGEALSRLRQSLPDAENVQEQLPPN